MSFLRHREIYRSDGGAEAGSGAVAAPCRIVSMSLRLAIPWPVALQQSRLPLHQLGLLCTQPAGKTTIFQRMAKAGLTACLSLGVHSICLHPGLTSGRRFAANPGWRAMRRRGSRRAAGHEAFAEDRDDRLARHRVSRCLGGMKSAASIAGLSGSRNRGYPGEVSSVLAHQGDHGRQGG